jgi:thymidylate synthase ThyX
VPSEHFSPAEHALLAPYVTNLDRPVFALQHLPEEVVAVLFAYYSRSRDSLRRNLLKLLSEGDLALLGHQSVAGTAEPDLAQAREKARQFHEKWVVGYGHACYDEATEVLTDQGWRAWQQVAQIWEQNGHQTPIRLATLNPDTGFLEYLPPVRIIRAFYRGLMYRVRAKAIDLCVTPNHKMWVCPTRTQLGRRKQNYQLIPAAELEGVPCVYQLAAKWQGPEPEKLLVGHCLVDACALMRLTGFFIGDGYRDSRYHSAVSFNLRKRREIDFLRQTVYDCGFEWRMHGAKHYVIATGLGDFLGQCYDEQRRKVVPGSLLQYGPLLLRNLLEGLLHSDGGVDKGHAIYDTTSEVLKDQLYEVALKVGWAANTAIHRNNHPDRKRAQLLYRVHFNQTRLKPEVNKVSYRKQDWWEKYEGFVYCAEMPCNHVLYVRRNSRPVWSGNSVAEHAVAHLAIEDVSIVASKVIEDMRLASYTEKSTRYVEFDTGRYYPLPELADTTAAALYHDTVRFLFTTYTTLLPQVVEAIQTAWPRPPGQSERGYSTACRAKALDLLRYLLPAATLTNLGMTINGRALEHLLTKMLSHPLPEVQQLGALLKDEAMQIMPTLLKYAQPNAYMAETDADMRTLVGELLAHETPTDTASVRLVRAPAEAETELVAALLYGYSQHTWPQVLARVQTLSWTQKAHVVDTYLRRRGPHDQPLRALEHLSYTFEILVDYGAYRDIHRHRMATQTRQLPAPEHGYSMPEELEHYGFQEVFETCMARAATTYQQLVTHHPQVASYVLPLAYRCRVLITWNLREMYHFVQLRSAKQGHTSYRQVAQAVYHALAQAHPLLARYMLVDLQDYALGRLEKRETGSFSA